MSWHHQRVYDALIKRRNDQKRGDRDIYVSVDHHRRGELSMVLYRPDSESYRSAPLHICMSRSGFSKGLFDKLAPAIIKTSRGNPKWTRYKVLAWDKFAEALDLSI